MSEPSNESRAEIAEQIAAQYVRVKEHGMSLKSYGEREAIVDLIADLCHLANLKGFDPEKTVDMALDHFEDEVADEEEDQDQDQDQESEEE